MLSGLHTDRAAPSAVPCEKRAVLCDVPGCSEDDFLFEVRHAGPDDLPHIPELFHDVYGGSYHDPGVYDAGHLAGKILRGELTSIVTATRDGRVVGYCALVKDSDRPEIASVTQSAVSYACRNKGLESKMLEEVIEEARRQGLRGLTSQSVTHHIFAQKAGQRSGFRRIGLQLAIISEKRTYDGYYPAPGRRQAVAVGYLPLGEESGDVLYAPDHHREFVDMLFREAGLKRSLVRAGTNDDRPLNGRTFMRIRLVRNDVARITIDRYGAAVSRSVGEMLEVLKARDMRHIGLELPLRSPATATVCHELEGLGFFVAGIMPHTSVGDALVLQYIHDARVDYDDIRAASAMLATIKSYVRCHDPNQNGP